jgi:hypothetical protein
MPLLLALLLCSCSPKQDNNVLQNQGIPAYGDMSAAEDAGKAK